MRAETRFVTCIWHPAPECGELFDIGNGVNARVMKGDAAYQTTCGEITALPLE